LNLDEIKAQFMDPCKVCPSVVVPVDCDGKKDCTLHLMYEKIGVLIAEAEQLQESQRWHDAVKGPQPLSEYPGYNKSYGVVIYTDNGLVLGAEWETAKIRGKIIGRYTWHGRLCIWKVVKWMSLPKPPKEGRP
jgi:hypothetical protein